jgi:hypothetical protein
MNLLDKLSEVTANLVEFEENELFLRRLFQLRPGVWADLDFLIEDLGILGELRRALKNSFQERVRVTWLDYSDSRYGDGYSLILFFAEEQQWHNVALYNKSRFESHVAQVNHTLIEVA